jgi:hypothetical protein
VCVWGGGGWGRGPWQCGFRDLDEYLSTKGMPDVWANTGFYKMLCCKDTGYFVYFKEQRMLEDKHLARVKTFSYEEGAVAPLPPASEFPQWCRK